MQIRKWDKVSTAKEVMGLDSISFENYKTHARHVHRELCADSKQDWGDASIDWGVLSVDEKRLAISWVRSRSAEIFGTEDEKAIEEGITQRLYHLRRDWQKTEKSRLAMQPGSASTPSEAAASQNATEVQKARPFDPARDLNWKENDT